MGTRTRPVVAGRTEVGVRPRACRFHSVTWSRSQIARHRRARPSEPRRWMTLSGWGDFPTRWALGLLAASPRPTSPPSSPNGNCKRSRPRAASTGPPTIPPEGRRPRGSHTDATGDRCPRCHSHPWLPRHRPSATWDPAEVVKALLVEEVTEGNAPRWPPRRTAAGSPPAKPSTPGRTQHPRSRPHPTSTADSWKGRPGGRTSSRCAPSSRWPTRRRTRTARRLDFLEDLGLLLRRHRADDTVSKHRRSPTWSSSTSTSIPACPTTPPRASTASSTPPTRNAPSRSAPTCTPPACDMKT